MIQPSLFYQYLAARGVEYFVGVPDSLLKNFCGYIADNVPNERHVITANEGNALALAAGCYIGTGKPALVYLQNSGLGNIINPLVSLCDREIYQIPAILLIGWRGEPGVKDEPQHLKQGRITTKFLETMEIPSQVISANTDNLSSVLDKSFNQIEANGGPVALLVKKGSFSKYKPKPRTENCFELSREDAIKTIINALDLSTIIVSTTGMTSRELHEYREQSGTPMRNDFLTVGSMGHASSIASGIAATHPSKKVICLDGDGAALMHLGAMAIIGQSKLSNLIHVVLNNGAHDSVGGQPTCGLNINFPLIARGCGYQNIATADTKRSIQENVKRLLPNDGPSFLEIRIKRGSRSDLGRPSISPLQNRVALMNALSY